MKIATREAEGFLTAPATRYQAALLFGPDSGLVRERAGRIKKAILGDSDDPFAAVELEESRLLEDPAKLADELLAISMLSPRRLITIRAQSDKITKVIEAAAEHFHSGAYLLVLGDELSTRSSLRVFFESSPLTAAVGCYRDEGRDLQQIISKALTTAGVSVDRDTMDYLVQQLGNDRYVTLQELEKITLYAAESKKLTLEDAEALVDYNRDMNLDDIVQAVADKNLQTLDRLLAVHLKSGAVPIIYLRSLLRYFNRLYYIRAQMASGKSADDVIRNLKPKVFFKQEQSLRRHIESWSQENIARALMLLTNAELAFKSSDLPPIAASSRRLMQVAQLR